MNRPPLFVVLVYHDGMSVPRQGPDDELLGSGRVNQKRRTRSAIAAAARELLAKGITPTVAQAAEHADVSRTTAYRYFPTQEALLVEVAINISVDEVDELVARPLDGETAEERLLGVLRRLNETMLRDEAANRTALRLYLDMWLEASTNGDEPQVLREGRRRRWIATSLDAFADLLSPAERRRLTAALSLVAGIEAVVALRDVCRLEPAEALEVSDWAAAAILRAALDERAEPPPPRRRARQMHRPA
jgi:AcrR family transcriptional regulator